MEMYSKMASIFIIAMRILCLEFFCFHNIFIASNSIVQKSSIQEQYARIKKTNDTVIYHSNLMASQKREKEWSFENAHDVPSNRSFIDPSPYAFHMFENFIAIQKVSMMEISNMKVLRKWQVKLHLLKEKLSVFLVDIRKISFARLKTGKSLEIKLYIRNCSVEYKDYRHYSSMKEVLPFFPNLYDYEGAVKAIVILHKTYNFNFTKTTTINENSDQSHSIFQTNFIEYSKPKIDQKEYKEKLAYDDYIIFSHHAGYFYRYYESATYFINSAFESIDIATALPKLYKYLDEMRTYFIRIQNHVSMTNEMTIGDKFKLASQLFDDNDNSMISNIHTKDLKYEQEMVRNDIFLQTCDTRKFSSQKTSSEGSCKYLHHDNNFLKLGPFKLEILRRLPYLSVFHEFIDNKQIEWLIRETTPKLSASRTDMQYQRGKLDGTVKIIEKTVQTWLQEFNIKGSDKSYEQLRPTSSQLSVRHPILYRISRNIHLATKLEMRFPTSSSMTQVTNYGLGGLCEVHNDPSGFNEGYVLGAGDKRVEGYGDILGTFMAWLNQVEGGGGTAFPKHEMLVNPGSIGSAAFWYSLDKKGFRHQEAEHGGCPVTKGSKWILNRWLYYFDNFRDFSCGLSHNDPFDIPKRVF